MTPTTSFHARQLERAIAYARWHKVTAGAAARVFGVSVEEIERALGEGRLVEERKAVTECD